MIKFRSVNMILIIHVEGLKRGIIGNVIIYSRNHHCDCRFNILQKKVPVYTSQLTRTIIRDITDQVIKKIDNCECTVQEKKNQSETSTD